jgi:hypothetical protein
MKFKVHMKDPDTLGDAIDRAVGEAVAPLSNDADERAAVAEVRRKRVQELCDKWFEYGEYLTVEIDTDAGTCVVVPISGA